MDNILTRLFKGLFKDIPPQEQPKGSYRFGLNGVMDTDQGDKSFVSNEESNEVCAALKSGYIPIGKEYIGNDRVVIFSVSADNTVSEIGIYYPNNCEYIAHVNDESSSARDKLGFSFQHQIQATYRLRRGCEDTIYWVDGNKKPRYYNFQKPEQFKRPNGNWQSSKFNLQRTYDTIPNFSSLEVLDSGGNLEPGSYNFAIQYIDESLNPTEWIATSPVTRIYNEISTKAYKDITGSINSDTDYINFPRTGKSIKLTLNNLDTSFLYYRLAVIVANNGSGLINNVFYTETIPVTKDFFIYTGSNHVENGTTEEILQFSDIIQKADTIEQIENRLILGNTEGMQADLCKIQKFASRIKADCIIKKVVLTDINDPANTKNPSHEFNNGLGYMPGEIYSFGIVYIFEDNSLSPVYHIPGKNPIDKGIVFSPSDNVPTFPMGIDNEGASVYTENMTCGASGYWGLDYNGTPLAGKPIRHHRFPLRSQIEVPLVETVTNTPHTNTYYNLTLYIKGDLVVPVPCPDDTPGCGTDVVYQFLIRVDYKVDGEDFFFIETIDANSFANGVDTLYELEIFEVSQFHSSNNFTDIKISYTDSNGDYETFDDNPVPREYCDTIDDYFDGNVCIETKIESFESSTSSKKVDGNILGIKFSGIEKPPIELTGGLEVIGYYIVRNERTEFEKTIFDTAVLFPTIVNKEYISHGLLQPETNNLSSNVFALLHPEHKFNQKEYVTYDKIIQEGNFDITERKYGLVNYDDVFDGSSYDSQNQSKENDDGSPSDSSPTSTGFDGWSFNLISRDNIVDFTAKNTFEIDKADIVDRFYLDALGHQFINDNQNVVYNIAADNRIGIVELDTTLPANNNLPYVALYKENADPYSNFRILPYYKETTNPVYFVNDEVSERSIFNGDTYISPMRYTNTVYWNNRIAFRQGKKQVWKIIVGGLAVIAGAALAFFTGGATVVVVGAGIALMGAGVLYASAGIKQENFNKAYAEEYEKGLRQTALDNFTDAFYNYKNAPPRSTFGYMGNGGTGQDGPSDDTIQWISDCITDLWFESTVNMNLRNGFINDINPTFLHAPGDIETGNNTQIGTWRIKFSGLKSIGGSEERKYTNSNAQRYPVSSLETHGSRKLLAFDNSRDDNRYYIGLPMGEYYHVNPDYNRRNTQKIFYHLPLEYDCCSECMEEFPHRIHYSEQSYQEELSDNFRVFLPNNYRDIEGGAGKITNLFRLGMDLFVHTEEALWMIPRNYQERITDQIVSFIGTGEYFAVPPRPIIDDETGNSAGCTHRWSTVKTPAGVFFVCENQNKVYQFDGKSLKAISNIGINSWFKNNIEVKTDREYYKTKKDKYPFRDNPSNPYGTGYISTYDSRKERVIFTKKDYILGIEFPDADFEICTRNGEFIIFPDISETIEHYEEEGWTYTGLEDCRMKFEREVIKHREEIRWVEGERDFNDYDVVIHFDVSPPWASLNFSPLDYITPTRFNRIRNLVHGYMMSRYPSWSGNFYCYFNRTVVWANSQRTWTTLKRVVDRNIFHLPAPSTDFLGVFSVPSPDHLFMTTSPVDISTPINKILAFNFVHENTTGSGVDSIAYHNNNGITNPTDIASPQVINGENDMAEHIVYYNALKSSGGDFVGINYPITYGESLPPIATSFQSYLQHVLSILKGRPYTSDEVDSLVQPTGLSNTDWDDLKEALQDVNPYSDGLENYGWSAFIGRTILNNSFQGDIILNSTFYEDIDSVIAALPIDRHPITVNVPYTETEFMYVDGEVVEDLEKTNNSWTLSYGLNEESWLFWHSYLPSFYIHIPEEFFSWIHGNSNIWKHNVLGSYQKFYGNDYPFIVEFVSLSNPVVTKVWDYIKLITEAKRFDTAFNEFVDERFITFNKGIFYNSRQCSGILNFMVKDINEDGADYLIQQVENLAGDTIIIDRNERDWGINQLRDIRVDYTEPIFNSTLKDLQEDYFIDKILNEDSLDYDKDWTQLESFRDKYLVVRLIFDNFDDIKLLLNYSVENEVESFR